VFVCDFKGLTTLHCKVQLSPIIYYIWQIKFEPILQIHSAVLRISFQKRISLQHIDFPSSFLKNYHTCLTKLTTTTPMFNSQTLTLNLDPNPQSLHPTLPSGPQRLIYTLSSLLILTKIRTVLHSEMC
jgi:hypothetical protein